jgi:hypothetical protein
MTNRLNRQNPISNREERRATFPMQQAGEGLFLGWGPKF